MIRGREEPWIRSHLVEVVGPHAAAQELLHEHLHHVGIVVHALEQHRLVAERNARVGQAAQRIAHLDGQFLGMIHVDAHPERVEFLQHRAKFRRDPLRQKDRHAAADAEKFDVLDGAQAAQQIFKPCIGKQKRVSAGKKHVAHLRVLLQIIDGAVEIEFEFLFAHAADDAAARAIPAIGRRSGP